jgi:RecB family exonuclease
LVDSMLERDPLLRTTLASRSTTAIDAAGADSVDGALSGPLLRFVRDAARYALRPDDRAARTLALSPFTGMSRADVRALCIAAGERATLAQAIAAERVPLDHPALLAARRFARALDELAQAYRAQGATAAEFVATVRLAFALDDGLDARERRTLEALERAAQRLDAERSPGVPFDARAFCMRLDRLAGATAAEGAPPAPRPLPGRAREAGRNVPRRRGHFSASSLGMFAECERRWFYRYVCAAVEDPGSSASFYGTAFHWALERFHQEFPRAGGAAPELLERKLEAYLGTAFERYRAGFATNVEFELQGRRARRTARRYLAWFLERSRTQPFTVVGTEASVALVLEGYDFIGYIDRLDRHDATGAITVIDYKTGSIAESAQAYRAKVAEFLDFQLPFYYWARTAQGDRVSRLALVPLKDQLREVRPIELEVVPVAAPRTYSDAPNGVIGLDELERARAKMVELARLLSDGTIEHFPVSSDPGACRYCAFRLACRERPLQREERFGR